ncbi:protein hook [Tribolium castaneum]|uniref:protein hook n=1 Tax=Tribolium castaneum TaxID=7070 RepID=UPI0030FE5FEF
MASRADVNHTIEQIRNVWPDLAFDREDVVQGRPEFIVRFCSNFIAEINDKISFLCNEESTGSEHPENPEFDKRVTLYCNVSEIYRKMKYISLNLSDFYVQNPKKMYTFLKCSIHFVIYLNNYLDEMYATVFESLKKLAEYEDLKKIKQELLAENAEYAEQLARETNTHESLKIKAEKVKKAHAKMLNDKAMEEKKLAEETAELSELQKEVDNLEYELKLLQDKEEDLKGSVVTKTDYENLKKMEKVLEREQGELDGDDFHTNDKIEHVLTDAKELEADAEKLQTLNFDSLDVNSLLQHREEFAQSKTYLNKLSEQACSLNNEAESKRKTVDKLQFRVDKGQASVAELGNKYSMEAENEQKSFEDRNFELAAALEECQRLESQSIDLLEEMKQIEAKESVVKKITKDAYRKILNKDREATNKFDTYLRDIVRVSRLAEIPKRN